MKARKPAPSGEVVAPRPDGRPTSYDVAMRAGVSQSAVSRCFRPGASVAPKTRARIMQAAQELGYQPNAIASGLITKRSNLVAIVISSLTNLYYPEVLAQLTRRLSDAGIRVLLFTLEAESDVDAMLDNVWRYRVDGAIVAARLSPDQLRDFKRNHVPVILYNRSGEGETVTSVGCDSMAGERILVDRLAKAGHRCFGIITGPQDSYVSQERVEAAVQRLAGLGLETHVESGHYDYASGGEGFARLFETTGKRIDALICANDHMALGAMDMARHHFGLRIPEDISIVGFDGVAPAQWSSYALTTVRQPVGRMTEAAVAMLMERIEDGSLPPESRLFSGMLIEGKSARIGDG